MEMPPLETERLVIRPLIHEDVSAVMSVLALSGNENEESTRRYLTHGVLSAQVLAELDQPPIGDRAMVLRRTGKLIGLAGLVPAFGPFDQLRAGDTGDVSAPALNRVEIGLYYHVRDDVRQQGYATEAAAALVQFAFDTMRLSRIVATTEHENAASQAVMRRLGMQLFENSRAEPAWFQVVGVLENQHRAGGQGVSVRSE